MATKAKSKSSSKAAKPVATKTKSAIANKAVVKKALAKSKVVGAAGSKKVVKTIGKKVAAPATKLAPKKSAAKSKGSAAAIKADRARVSKQGHELAYVAKKHGVDEAVVTKIIARVGNMRKDVEAAIVDFKKRSLAADKALVSSEAHEISYLAKKFNVSSDAVLAVVKEHGPSRKHVEAALKKIG